MSPHRMLGERLANYPWACWNSNCRAAPCEGSAIAVSCAHRDEPQSQALQHQARHEDAQMYGPRAHAAATVDSQKSEAVGQPTARTRRGPRPSLPADVLRPSSLSMESHEQSFERTLRGPRPSPLPCQLMRPSSFSSLSMESHEQRQGAKTKQRVDSTTPVKNVSADTKQKEPIIQVKET